MKTMFIEKLKTKSFFIGSFDCFEEQTKTLIIKNSNLTEDKVKDILYSMPNLYRASITDKNYNYLGYIGIYDYDPIFKKASIRFETINSFSVDEKHEIINEYRKWLEESINIYNITQINYISKDEDYIVKDDTKFNLELKCNNEYLKEGIDSLIRKNIEKEHKIPNLKFPFTITYDDLSIGIVGLTNLLWANERANINIYFINECQKISRKIIANAIEEYLKYIHKIGVYNVSLEVSSDNRFMLDIIRNTNFRYYAQIPFGTYDKNNIKSNLLFEHLPNIQKSKFYIPITHSLAINSYLFKTKDNMDLILNIDNKYRLVSPKAFEKEHINKEDIIDSHVKAMKNREKFTIPLGEEKYIMQYGNKDYGFIKTVMNYSYILLDNFNNYCGYVSILRANCFNAEIEIGIVPSLQRRGIGTKVISKFYNELFAVGFLSVTSIVFEFNEASIKLHNKVSKCYGKREKSYYIKGRLWDMYYYTKINDKLEKSI